MDLGSSLCYQRLMSKCCSMLSLLRNKKDFINVASKKRRKDQINTVVFDPFLFGIKDLEHLYLLLRGQNGL